MFDKRRLVAAVIAKCRRTKAVSCGLILVSALSAEAYAGPSITEDGTDQAITFILPPGVARFPVFLRSDVGGLIEDTFETGTELADLLTVTFPGQAQQFAAGESGSVAQNGFVTPGMEIDEVAVNDAGLAFTVSDRVGLFIDPAGRLAVAFTSDGASAPEPATALILGTGLILLFGYRWRR